MKMKAPCMVVAAWILAIGLSFPKPTTGYTTLDFTVTTATTGDQYGTFIGNLRTPLQGGTFAGIPLLRKNATANQLFVLVRLSNGNQAVTLALNVIDLYLVGYLADGNQFWHFSDFNPTPYQNLLFQGSTKRRFGFTGSYPDLARDATERRKIPLGKKELVSAVTTLFNTATYKNQAPVKEALTVTIQLICESARFGYITGLVSESFRTFNAFKPKDQVISYQNNWGALSKSVQAGNGVNLNPPVQLTNDAGKTYTVTRVADLNGKLSLMKAF